MKRTKLRITNHDPRGINRTLFGSPFSPSVNLALEDPLLLSCHPAVQKEGLAYATYFGGNSPLSVKAPEFLKKKILIESIFSQRIGKQKTLILPAINSPLAEIAKSFLSGQIYLVPDSIRSPFPPEQTITFDHDDLASLKALLATGNFESMPIVFMPVLCPIYGKIDYPLFKEIKEQTPFFFITEDSHTFGLEGLDGSHKKSDMIVVDLIITHIPKTFGKMLTLISGKADFLDTLLEYSFCSSSLFPPAPYLGMLNACLEILPVMEERREAIKDFSEKIAHTFSDNVSVYSPLLTFHLHSSDEKSLFTKSLVDKGFLLPASAFKQGDNHLTFSLNHLLEERSIHSLYEIHSSMQQQTICESI
ncbi:MAG: hypothetical protein SP4CHLAM5_11810 [Chlamydiia bacterium]|nr:hypothetical protein [Chlamydiia bacterium]MCH9619036.1 hypothetical protein [Chlamydiia bacterium]MCH9624791.1 hypothetical protein [Chlamydiia bacterium]